MNRPPPPGDRPTRTSPGPGALLAPGARLADRYRVVELLGAGGMGLVYQAVDERLGVDVALKVLRPEHAVEAGMLERFRQELVLARQVSHRNVVRIHDIGEHDTLLFLTMDLVAGRSLKAILAEEGRLEPPRAVEIARQLAEALAEAHREGVVHRDLKPANVLVDPEGTAYVTDFGIARSLTGAGITQTGGIVGTVEYLSPEQARGEPVDARSDLYSLGLVLYEMLAGRQPFAGATWSESLGQRLTATPPDLAAALPAVPRWLAQVVGRCLERRPDDRYQSADELARDLAARRFVHRRRLPIRWLADPAARRVAWVLAAAALLAVVAVLWWRRGDEVESPAAGSRHAVAILPFVDETGDPDLSWVSTGIADMLSDALAESPTLAVVDSLRVVRTLDDLKLSGRLAEADQRLISELLGADRLVSGQVRGGGERVRIDARLLAILPGEIDIRAFRGEGGMLTAVDHLAEQLRTALEVAAPPEAERPAIGDLPPAALAAYGAGVEALRRGDAVSAAPALERAVALAPDFAAAWTRLAGAYADLGFHDRAVETARRAVAELPRPAGRLGFEARAQLALLSGDAASARQILGELVQRWPEDVEARVGFAEALGDEGRLGEARRELERAVEHDPHHPRAWFLLGKFAILGGDYRRAADDYLVRALVIQNRLKSRQGQADAANALGLAHLNLGELDQAVPAFEQAAALRREIGDRRGTAATLSNLGMVQTRRGDHAAARSSFEESLAIREEIGDRDGVAHVHNAFGMLEEEQGSYREALVRFRRALELRRELGNTPALAESSNNVGYAYYLLGEYDNAGVYWEQARRLSTDTGNREATLVARQSLGLLHVARGRWDAAIAEFLTSLEEARALDIPHARAVALGNLGTIARHQGRYDAALASYGQAIAELEAIEDPRGLVEYQLKAAGALLDVGDHQAAAARLASAGELLADEGNREQRAELARLEGQRALALGDPATARAAFSRARAEAAASGGAVARIAADLGLARSDLAGRRAARSLAAAREALELAEALGNAVLRLEALETVARAELATGEVAAAVATTARALAVARDHQPYSGAYRLHLLRAEALAAHGDAAGARTGLAASAREVARLRGDLTGDARRSFDQLPEVRSIDEQTRTAADAA